MAGGGGSVVQLWSAPLPQPGLRGRSSSSSLRLLKHEALLITHNKQAVGSGGGWGGLGQLGWGLGFSPDVYQMSSLREPIYFHL